MKHWHELKPLFKYLDDTTFVVASVFNFYNHHRSKWFFPSAFAPLSTRIMTSPSPQPTASLAGHRINLSLNFFTFFWNQIVWIHGKKVSFLASGSKVTWYRRRVMLRWISAAIAKLRKLNESWMYTLVSTKARPLRDWFSSKRHMKICENKRNGS